MKPQAIIEKNATDNQTGYKLFVEQNDQLLTVDEQFTSYQDALDYILQQGWQLKRESPAGSLHVDIRFRKP